MRFEEDNWESPTLGAWGIGWQVLLDGLEITQFTYFQQCGGIDLDPVSVELTYGLDRICAYLQGVDNVFDVRWSDDRSYGAGAPARGAAVFRLQLRLRRSRITRKLFDLHEKEAASLLDAFETRSQEGTKRRFPVLAAYDQCLKCSHLFNVLDSRGVISVTERAPADRPHSPDRLPSRRRLSRAASSQARSTAVCGGRAMKTNRTRTSYLKLAAKKFRPGCCQAP